MQYYIVLIICICNICYICNHLLQFTRSTFIFFWYFTVIHWKRIVAFDIFKYNIILKMRMKINRQIKKVFSMKHEMLYNMKSHHILTVYAFPFVLTLKHLEVDWNMILISVRPASIRWKYIFFFYHFLSFNNCKVCNAY